MAQLYPALHVPTHELNLQRRDIPSANNSRGSVVLLEIVVHDQAERAKIRSHRRARIWRWMLDVGPVDIAACEFEIGFDGFRSVAGISDNQSADDIHLVAVEVVHRLQRGIADDVSLLALLIFGSSAEERESVIENVFDPEEHIPEAGLPHQRCERFAVVGDARCHRLDDVVNAVELFFDNLPAQPLESVDVQSDIVINEKDSPSPVVVRITDIRNDPAEIVRLKITPSHFDDRAEAAIERAASRSFHHIHLAAQHRVAAQHTRVTTGRPYLVSR